MIDRIRSAVAGPYRRWLPAVLIGVSLANVGLTPFLPEHAQPLKWHASPDLGRLVFEERESVGVRFGIYEHLREAAGGGTLVTHPGGAVDPHVARGLGGVSVEVREYDAGVDVAGLPVSYRGVFDGPGEAVEYLVLEGTADLWWEGIADGRVVLVPDSLLAAPEVAGG